HTRWPRDWSSDVCSSDLVVQYQKLGLNGFATRYVKGFLTGGSYGAIPLEMNAYELDACFAAAPANAFPVEDEVQELDRRGNVLGQEQRAHNLLGTGAAFCLGASGYLVGDGARSRPPQ